MDGEDSLTVTQVAESGTVLGFVERSLRQYFREENVERDGLRSNPSMGHAIVETLYEILTNKNNRLARVEEWATGPTIMASSIVQC
jgi:hypothetical protein